MIEIENLSKAFQVAKRTGSGVKSLFKREYETVHAIKDVSFTVQRGEMVGYIGPNGAGKSTTIKIMSGVLTPTSGKCLVNGLVPWESRKKHVQNIGVVFGQKTQLWWDVPVIDSFQMLKSIYKIPEHLYQSTFDELVEMLKISDLLKTPVRQLSLGQRMRVEIAASLLHCPDLLFLDEPTIGLDASSKLAVRDFIKNLNKTKNTTVILTTHDMQDIEALTNRIVLIGKGEKLYDGDLEAMKRSFVRHKKLMVNYESSQRPFLMQGCEVINQNHNQLELMIDLTAQNVPTVIGALSQHYALQDIAVSGQPIEETILNLYERFEVV